MNHLRPLIRNLRLLLGAFGQLFSYGLLYCWALLSPKAVLAARLVASESQLGELHRHLSSNEGRRPRFRFSPAFRILWSVLSRLLDGWEALAHLMKPETVVSWHRTAFRLFWWWRSKSGRKPIGAEMQQLIRRISEENPLWGPKRIRDTLLLLGYEAPCEETIRKYMVKSRKPRPKTTNWLAFLRNHLDVSWAIDFFTLTTLGFQTLYVFLVFNHARREVLHFALTPHPTMEWVIQQLREATPFGKQPQYVLRDNDGIFGYGVRAFLEGYGIQEGRTAYDSPW